MPSDAIRTRPSTKEYRDGWERTFGLRAIMEREHAAKVECIANRCGAMNITPDLAAAAFGEEIAERMRNP